jgi:AcrR family transcriptional regulator
VLIHSCIVSGMSRERTRPTREETAERLIAAAIEVFQRDGIAGSSIEDIAVEAGLTRGAFYSSFSNKEELVVELLQQQVARSLDRNQTLAARYRDPAAFLQALASNEERDKFVATAPLLNFELMLFAIRTAEHRSAVSRLLQTLRTTVGEIVVSMMREAGVTRDLNAQQIGALLMALEDGFDLHRLIDPKQTPADSYTTALKDLQDLLLATRAGHYGEMFGS